MTSHPLTELAKKYPQLRLPIREGEKDTDEYKNVVLRGAETDLPLEFSFSESDTLDVVRTPAGDVDVLYLKCREDFEHAVRSLAYRCEPKEIPASMGASTISGLINWEKINSHLDDLDSFLKDKRNYLDTLILLSDGPYSAVDAKVFNEDENLWREKSLIIRKYHELTHFVSIRLFPENKDAVRDEIIADMIGIISAFDMYDTEMAKTFLGTEGREYRNGGRLQNYAKTENINDLMQKANNLIDILKRFSDENNNENIFALLNLIESNKIGL